MTDMQKFGSIEQYRNVVANVRRYADFHRIAAPTVTFKGTVKLHGSHGGVVVAPDGLTAQSRNNVLSFEDDNAGFAKFVQQPITVRAFAILAHYLHYAIAPDDKVEPSQVNHFIFYGEWCGGSIQKGVGLNNLPKHFVVFKAFDTNTGKFVDIDWQTILVESDRRTKEFMAQNPLCVDETIIGFIHAGGVYLIDEVDPKFITIDFSKPEAYTQEMEDLTLAYEDECPWAAMFGHKNTVGEGIVWSPTGEFADKREWLFKIKGIKHQKSDKNKPTNLVHVDPIKVAAIAELIAAVLPPWRLEQGLAEVKQANGGVISTKNMGEYLQWISRDILKEESDVIANNEYDWKKDISPKVIQKARDYFLRAPL